MHYFLSCSTQINEFLVSESVLIALAFKIPRCGSNRGNSGDWPGPGARDLWPPVLNFALHYTLNTRPGVL
jgi:hypothetical protein